MSTTHAPEFPASRIPENPATGRLLGLYPQVQEGLWLQRTKIPGGILTGRQWRQLAAIARRFTPDTPLHLTTRQDIEIHDLRAEQVPLVQQEMAQEGLTGLGACGDTVRNITVCPCSGLLADSADVGPVAGQIRQLLEAADGVYALPRKFKISLSACAKGCAQPFINDVGLVALQRDGAWGFRVIVAGSLGARPNTGIELFDWLPAAEVVPLVLAALRVFAEHGDRTNRTKARLRHVRERLGNEPFVALLKQTFDRTKQERAWPAASIAPSGKTYSARTVLNFLNGDVAVEAADALGDLSEQPDTCVRISNHHQVVVFGMDPVKLAARIGTWPALREAARPAPTIVACPGKRWCKHGLTDTNAMAKLIREQLAGTVAAGTTVCIAGCPNGCTQGGVAEVGLSGVLTTVDGVQHQVYNLVGGGGMGRDERLASPLAQRLLPEQVVQRIAAEPQRQRLD